METDEKSFVRISFHVLNFVLDFFKRRFDQIHGDSSYLIDRRRFDESGRNKLIPNAKIIDRQNKKKEVSK